MVYCIGNNNYDIFFNNRQVIGGSPGGSMLNVAVSLGRMGVAVQLITSLAKDHPGNIIAGFLAENGVALDYADFSENRKTSIALAALDDAGKPVYSFYGSPEEFPELRTADLGSDDVLLFGSSYAIHPSTSPVVEQWIARATQNNVVKVYDPNIRKKCAFQIEGAIDKAQMRMRQADIIKLSDEDLQAVGMTQKRLRQQFSDKIIVLTQGEGPVLFFHGSQTAEIPTNKITPENTTGAGDAFNAGLIRVISQQRITLKDLKNVPLQTWISIIESANDAAATVCCSSENYVPKNSR